MRRANLTLTLLAGIAVAGAFVPVLSSPLQPARAAGPTVIYFPWVQHNEMVGNQGPWFSELMLQNLSDDICPLSIYIGRDGVWVKTTQLSMLRKSSRPIASRDLGLRDSSAPVRIDAFCDLAASLKSYTPDTLVSPWSDGAHVVTGYTGVSSVEVAAAQATDSSAWVLPIVQTNSGWNTFIRVANVAAVENDVSIELYEAGNAAGAAGVFRTYVMRVPTASVWTLDLATALQVPGWVGFARIVSDAEIAVIAHRVKPSTAMALTNVAVAVDSAVAGEQRTLAPLLFNAYNGWNTGINLANPSEQPTSVRVLYYAAGGGMINGIELTLAARSMQYIYTPGNVTTEGFVGSAAIFSNAPVVGAVDEVKYETTEALSYMTSSLPQTDAAIPVVFRENPANGHHDNSGINIANLSAVSDQQVQVDLIDPSGVSLLTAPITVTLPAGGNAFVYLPFVPEIPSGTFASARIMSSHEAGFVAISNDINYAVSGDGSVVFAATGAGGYYRIPTATEP
jgi:hypothetical protein